MSALKKKHPFDFKTQYGLSFNQQDDEIVVDFFCGSGGSNLYSYRRKQDHQLSTSDLVSLSKSPMDNWSK